MTDPHKVTASKLMPQSPSSIEKFETCPRQYAHSYIIKDIPYRESPAQKEGNQFHEMAHLRLSLGAQTPKQYAQYEPLFERVAAWPALDTEVKSAVGPDWLPCEWRKRFVGGVIDVRSVDHDRKRATVLDWKHGMRIKQNPLQITINAVTTMAEFPSIETVKVAFVYTKLGKLGDPLTFSRASVDQMRANIGKKIHRIKVAHETATFPPTPNGLCKGWCEVKNCEHYREF